MGFIKDLFKKEEYNPDKFAIPTKTKQIPEYHRCPVCGHENKTKQRDWSKYTQMYLDGQYKIAIQDYVDEYYYCPECGFVYSNGEIEDGFPEGYFTGKIKNTVFSQAYQDIRCSNLEETYKKILLMDLISKCDMKIFLNINQIWLNYYESIDNEKKKQYYLQKRIKETPDGYSYNADVRYGESVIQFPESYRQKAMYISTNEILTDLNRRAGNFDEAKRLAEYALNTYEFTNTKDPLKALYQYQLELIEAQDKKHI